MLEIVIDFCKRILRYAVENVILHYFNKSFETASDVESGFTCYAQRTNTWSLHKMYSSLNIELSFDAIRLMMLTFYDENLNVMSLRRD